MENSKKGKMGEIFVREYLTNKGYEILDQKRNGSDIIARIKNKRPIAIEVKTTSNLSGGIPDMHLTEFYERDGLWYFVADFLYIVRLNNEGIPTELDILSKKEIDSFADSHKLVRRIRTTKLDKAINKETTGKKINLI